MKKWRICMGSKRHRQLFRLAVLAAIAALCNFGNAQADTGTPVAWNTSTTLSWSSSNSTGCTAPWMTSTATSGSQVVGPITINTTYAIDCGGPGGNASTSVLVSVTGGPPDTTPPSVPGVMTKTAATETAISVSWGASSDNVGVTGYGLYVNGSSVSSTTGFNYQFTGLKCGTSYTLAVDAYDAAGNRSGKATLAISTTACPLPPAPVVTLSTNPTSVTTNGTSTLSWNATNSPSTCTASGGWSGAKVASGHEAVGPLAATATFSLTCANAGGSNSASVTVKVTEPPPETDPCFDGAQPGGPSVPWEVRRQW